MRVSGWAGRETEIEVNRETRRDRETERGRDKEAGRCGERRGGRGMAGERPRVGGVRSANVHRMAGGAKWGDEGSRGGLDRVSSPVSRNADVDVGAPTRFMRPV